MKKEQSFTTLVTNRRGAIRHVIFNNPPVNLMNRAMLNDLARLLGEIENDEGTRVVIFSSANPEFFICHADLKMFAPRGSAKPTRPSKLNSMNAMFEAYRTLNKATIAVLTGRTNGAGTEFALSLDMRFASRDNTYIGQFEVALGCLPGGTGTQRMPALAGRSRALELILGCDEIDAETAELYGLINRAFDPGALTDFVDKLARRIASFPNEAIALAKRAVDAGLPDPLPGLLEESHLAGQLMAREATNRRFQEILSKGAQSRSFELELSKRLVELGET